MSIDILNLKDVGLNILVLFILLITVESTTITGPQREVVSIYNNNFTTPSSRYPYFIEVYRCVKVSEDDFLKCGTEKYPVQKSMAEIEIVVPDLRNEDRGPSNKKMFHKYIVYNHTSCKCVGRSTPEERKLYKEIINNEVSEKYFKAKYPNNPVNLRSQRDFCNKTQIRYKRNPHENVDPQFQYLAYQECLPGCVAKSNKKFLRKTRMGHGGMEDILLTNDITCEAYDTKMSSDTVCVERNDPLKSTQAKREPRGFKEDTGNTLDQETNAELFIYIDSGKIILAAFLLSLVLFTILIIEFTLCRRKKGLFYAMFDCKGNVCQHCTERNRNEITV